MRFPKKIKRDHSKLGPDDIVGVERRNLADALFKSIVRCRYQRVYFLLSNGVLPTVVNDAGQNVLIASLYIQDEAKRDTMFQFLARRGADCCFVDKKTGRDVLSWAAYMGRRQQAEYVLDSVVGEVNLHGKDKDGKTPLHHAVITGHTDVVDVLVKAMQKYGLSLDVPDSSGLTPYIYAKRLGYTNIIDVLMSGGCSSEQFDTQNFHTAEEWAQIGRNERRAMKKKQLHLERAGIQGGHKPLPAAKIAKLPALKLTSVANETVCVEVEDADPDEYESTIMPYYQSRETTFLSDTPNSEPRNDSGLLKPTDSLLWPVHSKTKASRPAQVSSSASSAVNEAIETKRMLQKRTGASVAQSLNTIMDIVAQQYTHAYRCGVRPPTPKATQSKAKLSTLAFIMKSGKKSKQQMNNGENSLATNVTERKSFGQMVAALTASKQTGDQTDKKKKKMLLPPLIGQ